MNDVSQKWYGSQEMSICLWKHAAFLEVGGLNFLCQEGQKRHSKEFQRCLTYTVYFQINMKYLSDDLPCLLIKSLPPTYQSGSLGAHRGNDSLGCLLPKPMFDFCVIKTKAAPSFQNPFGLFEHWLCVTLQQVEEGGMKYPIFTAYFNCNMRLTHQKINDPDP